MTPRSSTPAPTRYVALLRGVNVGGRARLPMAALREACVAAGCADVATYIQSGNVVLTSEADPDRLARDLDSSISDRAGVSTTVLVRTAAELAEILAANPYPDVVESTLHVAFCATPPDPGPLEEIDGGPESLAVVGREVYLHLPAGMGRARLPVAMERKLTTPVTVRSWRTVNRLVAMSRA